jgi:hypothetical protein
MKLIRPSRFEIIVANIKFRIALAKASYKTMKQLTK